MDNSGMDALNMADGSRMTFEQNGENFAATVSVFNQSNSILGDFMKHGIGSQFNKLGLPGLEESDHTWDRIISGGAFKDGVAIGHSQGAHILAEAIARNVDPKSKDKINFYVAGGAHVNFPTQHVNRMYDLRNPEKELPAPVHQISVGTVNAKATPQTWWGNPVRRLYNGIVEIKNNALNFFGASTPSVANIDGLDGNNYYQLNQTASGDTRATVKWGGTKFNQRVNGQGHGVLQYLNAIDYVYANTEHLNSGVDKVKEKE
jgi:hypothetical protein